MSYGASHPHSAPCTRHDGAPGRHYVARIGREVPAPDTALFLMKYVWLGFPVLRLQPRAPASTGKPHCRVLDGKTQVLTNQCQRETASLLQVPPRFKAMLGF